MQEEVQYFTATRWFVYMITAGLFVLAGAGILQFYTWPWWWIIAIIGAPVFLTGLILWLIFRKASLVTTIDASGIAVRWSAGMKEAKMFPWSEIKELEIIDNPRPGFAGYKYSMGSVFVCMMNPKAARIEMNDGKTWIIGTNKPEIWKKN